MKEIKKLQAKGLYDRERDDPFELFVSSTTVKWCALWARAAARVAAARTPPHPQPRPQATTRRPPASSAQRSAWPFCRTLRR